MSVERPALLFCPPLPPVEVRSGSRIVIGRGLDCGFPVFTDGASRRHAEVYVADGTFLVRDLRSKNGTQVNGALIGGPQALEPGDKITVGSAQITFCRVESSLDGFLSDPSEYETAFFNRPGGRDASQQESASFRPPEARDPVFRGNLSDTPIYVVLQLLEVGQKTGLLEIETDHGPMRFWLEWGQPLHAETKTARGAEAARALLATTRGQFRFDTNAPLPERTLLQSMTELLLNKGSRVSAQGSRQGTSR